MKRKNRVEFSSGHSTLLNNDSLGSNKTNDSWPYTQVNELTTDFNLSEETSSALDDEVDQVNPGLLDNDEDDAKMVQDSPVVLNKPDTTHDSVDASSFELVNIGDSNNSDSVVLQPVRNGNIIYL